MKYIITSIFCLVVGMAAGWYMVHSRMEVEVEANMTQVVIMRVASGDGQERTYTETRLRNIAEQYLYDHHVTVHRDGIGLIVHMKPMDVGSHPIFATVVFSEGGQDNHAVDIGADGTAIRDYVIEPAKPN